jgi:hypothetical protein
VYATEDAKGKKYLEMMNELKGKYSASVLLCHSDGIRTLERLGQRAFYAEGVDKVRNLCLSPLNRSQLLTKAPQKQGSAMQPTS